METDRLDEDGIQDEGSRSSMTGRSRLVSRLVAVLCIVAPLVPCRAEALDSAARRRALLVGQYFRRGAAPGEYTLLDLGPGSFILRWESPDPRVPAVGTGGSSAGVWSVEPGGVIQLEVRGFVKADGTVVTREQMPRGLWEECRRYVVWTKTGPRLGPVDELRVVTWGSRLYLVAPSELPLFTFEVRAGLEPRVSPEGHYLLRAGGWRRVVTGLPRLPK